MKLYKCPSCETPESYNYDAGICNIKGCVWYQEILDYPEVTWGSIVAEKTREACNNLTNEERAELIKAAIERIEKGKRDFIEKMISGKK
jgi:hypothetical protein